MGQRTLLPADNLFLFEPYRTKAGDFGIGVPQNPLLSDLILENYAWKRFLKEAFRNRQLPLWDPYIFAGHPFFANGQHSALYPLSLVFYVLPLWRAYGVFAWMQLGLAGVFAYLFARVLGIHRLGGVIAGVTFQFSGFMVVSIVHPMIVAAASWLPFILAMVELVVQRRSALGGRSATLPWAALGALGLGCQMLAGHAENTYFVLLVTASYTVWRLGGLISSTRWSQDKGRGDWRKLANQLVHPILWLTGMLALGLALGAVQFIPLYEAASSSFRAGGAAASLQQVRGWAYPARRLITFLIPNFFGNPAHHSHFDLFQWRSVAATVNAHGEDILSHEAGIKNYVEGGAYLGLLPLFLAFIAVSHWLKPHVLRLTSCASRTTRQATHNVHAIPFFTLLSLFSLGCIFGTPLYALVYALPLLKQSHSPFRWVFPLTLSVAVLAGFGVEAVQRSRGTEEQGREKEKGRSVIGRLLLLDARPSLVSVLAALAFWGGMATLAGLVLSRAFFGQVEALVERAFWSLARIPSAFGDHRAFYSYEFKWIGILGLLLIGTGIVLRVSRCPILLRRRPVWGFLMVGLLVLDFVAFGMGFHPAVDPALLEYVPPAVKFLKQDTSLWRYATFAPSGTTKTMNANVGMFYDLQCVAGYDSLFSRQYSDYMTLIEEQDQLRYNRIASFSEWSSLDSPLTDLLNVKYVITEVEIPSPKYKLVYEGDAVRIYENLGAMPRAFTLPISATVESDDFAAAAQKRDPRRYVILEDGNWRSEVGGRGPDRRHTTRDAPVEQPVSRYTINEVSVDATVSEPSWLILADSYAPGWKAFVRPRGAEEGNEHQVEIHRVDGNFRGVLLEPGVLTVRFKYSPNSVKVGAFVSFIAGMTVLFSAGLYLWRYFYREPSGDDTVRRVAKNSLAPMVLTLFNRVIDFAFAALMARILGPKGLGRYATATNIYLWFDTLANFGLDMYLMREIAQNRDRARQIFVNATMLRLLLFAGVVPMLGGFLAGRQAMGTPLPAETTWAVALLYVGLLPGTLANSLTALFRGCEKHEYPAAIQTVTTIIKVTLGTLALAGGLGIIGLAGVSILTNVVTMTVLAVLVWRLVWPTLPRTEVHLRWPLQGTMLAESWPLMASLLLQSLFTGVTVVLLQYYHGDSVVGWYDAARKWVMNMLNVVPSLFTFAVFPVLSRQAVEDPARLRRSYRLSAKLLIMIALPVAISVTLLAAPMVQLLSGSRFLPHGAVALRILVWSILFGWLNSLTNYVLIALDRQRHVVFASGARVLFTTAANVLLVGPFSYAASTGIIIGGELLLALLFHVEVRRQLGTVAWGEILGRPILAGLAMGATAWAVSTSSRPLALLASVVVYLLALILLRALTAEELKLLSPLLPAPLREVVLIT